MILTNKEKYREYCKNNTAVAIFQQYWWLDTVCGNDRWDVCIHCSDGKINGALPYYLIKKAGLNHIVMPPLTPKLGVLINYPKNQKYEAKKAFEKKIVTQLIKTLPKFDFFEQSFDYNFQNWLPFYWSGFQQTTRYSYIISGDLEINEVYNSFKSSVRTDIKKAEGMLRVEESEDIEKFYELNSKTFSRQNLQNPCPLELLKKIDAECGSRNVRKIFFAIDENTLVHAAVYLVMDAKRVYYLLSGSDQHLRSSGALTLLLWESIKFSISNNLDFDFEGSMIESIEKMFRAFGGIQYPYFQISKINSRFIKTKKFLKSVLR